MDQTAFFTHTDRLQTGKPRKQAKTRQPEAVGSTFTGLCNDATEATTDILVVTEPQLTEPGAHGNQEQLVVLQRAVSTGKQSDAVATMAISPTKRLISPAALRRGQLVETHVKLMWRHVYRHVHRHVYRQVYRHAYRHVCHVL